MTRLSVAALRRLGRAPAGGDPPVRRGAGSDAPDPDIRGGLLLVGLFFGVFLGWAAIAPLDAAANAEGAIAVAGNRRTVQHREGGVVSALHVREGQTVRAGEVLLELAGDDVRAAERAATAQVIGLQARQARLQAEQAGAAEVTPPPAFAALPALDRAEADRALATEQAELIARRAAMGSQRGVVSQQSLQIARQLEGYRDQIRAQDEQLRLTGDELRGLESLAAKGFVSQNRVRALQRTAAALEGSKAELQAAVGRAQAQLGESTLQSATIRDQRAESVAAELRQVAVELAAAAPQQAALTQQLARTRLRAPVDGQVLGLTAFTVGGVIEPGQAVLQIVPDRSPLLLEAQIAPDDADDVQVGLRAEIRITGLRGHDLPRLEGEVTRLSPDSFVEERTGRTYYTATVTVPPETLNAIRRARPGVELRPGLPAQIVIPLRKRTALAYLLEPLDQAFWRAFREH